MANSLYGYSHSGSHTPSTHSSTVYSTAGASLHDPYVPESTRWYLSRSDPDLLTTKYSSNLAATLGSSSTVSAMFPHLTGSTSRLAYSQLLQHQDTWPPSVDVSSGVEPLPPGVKRSSDALYYPTILGAHNTIGQTDAWYTTEYLPKRSRVESASNLPIYPQRPGEKDCTHYMQTRTCKFGDSCKFDHPIWVPEGGIPDWKEAPPAASGESYPERPGEPDCPYFLKTQRCKYGSRCKFNHPKDTLTAAGASEQTSALPERPSEPACAFYMKTGKCKYGATCKFHHPKDIQILSAGRDNGNAEQYRFADKNEARLSDASAVSKTTAISTPALHHNSKGLPIRAGEVDCPFYLKTGSCKYGATCRYNHPDRNAFIPPVAAIGHPLAASSASNYSIRLINPTVSLYQTLDPRFAHTTIGAVPTNYPQRPGQQECDYYMKTGECKFGERCKFHHPIDRSAGSQISQGVKLTLAGLPRREGAVHCPYYMKTGTCKYGATCKFDHPPPGEVMSTAPLQGTSSSAEEEGKDTAR